MIYYRQLATIKAMSFDLDDTLYDNAPYMRKAEQQLMVFLHRSFSKTRHTDHAFWRRCKARQLFTQPELHSDMGLLRKKTIQQGLFACGYSEAQAEAGSEQCFQYFYQQRSDFKVDKNICSLLSRLARKIPLIAITNGNVDLDRIGIGRSFQLCFKANLTQPMKPSRHMFNQAVEYLSLPAKQILHVGDNLNTDVYGAINAGFASAWYAHNRPMRILKEPVKVLPHVQLHQLNELEQLI